MKAWFLSDIHLRDSNERNSLTLLRFLRSLAREKTNESKLSQEEMVKTTHLFLVGDIFDLWIGDSTLFYQKFKDIVEAIVSLKEKGVQVHYWEGNHDVHIKKFWEAKYQIPVHVDEKIFQLGSRKIRIEHGDFINPQDEAYLKYRDFIRRPFMEQIAYLVPGWAWDKIGNYASQKSRKHSSMRRQNQQEEFRQMIRSYAEKTARNSDFDILITGHMHIQDYYEFQVDGQKKISINLGSWLEEPTALLMTDSKCSFELLP